VGIESRPYVGTWQLNGRELVQHTPDALVYLNGDTALPGCSKCSGKIDIQKFLTEVSVDAGTEPGGASATFSLSIPLHHTDSFARDAKFLLRPGLEVHVYMRGYFPVAGLYKHLAEPKVVNEIVGSTLSPSQASFGTDPLLVKPIPPTIERLFDGLTFEGQPLSASQRANIEIIYKTMTDAGFPASFALAAVNQARFESNWTATAESKPSDQTGSIGGATGLFQLSCPDGLGCPVDYFMGGRAAGTTQLATDFPEKYYDGQDPVICSARVASAAAVITRRRKTNFRDTRISPKEMYSQFYLSALGNSKGTNLEYRTAVGKELFGDSWTNKGFSAQIAKEVKAQVAVVEVEATPGLIPANVNAADVAQTGPSLLGEMGLAGLGIENTLAYPYYHVFHGIVTEVTHSYSGGVNTVSVNCSSMLHFWAYQNMSTNASVFGARPTNSKLKMSLVGHNFTGMHPYAIMYTLFHDMVGAAGGVGWALASKSNQTSVSEVGGESLFSLNIRYWERRFANNHTRLRMHGATGDLFSTMTAAWLSRTSSANIMRLMRSRYNDPKESVALPITNEAESVGFFNASIRKAKEAAKKAKDELTYKKLSADQKQAGDATSFGDRSKGDGKTNTPKFEINIVEMQAFVSNIGNWGQVNLFESSYETKMEVAEKVMGITGFEFYQDVDGDFVFKPPMWNLDTSKSRVYRIEDIDIINISFIEKEPAVTYMTCKGSQIKNIGGTGLENEWGVKGQFIDYRLVAQYGWRAGSLETAYFNDSKSMFFAAVNRMDVMNIAVKTASLTIPVRPELRPGFPVYIPYLDAFYYCNSFAHSHAVGGQCTTSLQLVGKRAKFYAPGHPASRMGNGVSNGIDDIDLGNTILPERPLRVIDQENHPRLSGFPNVVMALDPTEINPLFFVVGSDLEDLSDLRVIRYILKIGETLGLVHKEDTGDGDTSVYVFKTQFNTGGDTSQELKVLFYFQMDDFKGVATKPKDLIDPFLKANDIPLDRAFNIVEEARNYDRLLSQSADARKASERTLQDLQGQILQLQSHRSELAYGPNREKPDFITQIEKLTAQIAVLEAAADDMAATINSKRLTLEEEWKDPADGKQQGVAFLLNMLNQVGAKYRTSASFSGRGDLSSTINLLDMLSDKKAIFSDGSQPGSYRYYSASHPKEEHQGPKVVEYDTSSKTLVVDGPPADLDGTAPEILMYAKDPSSDDPNAMKVEAKLVKGKPVKGIRVLNSNSEFPMGQSMATSDILELMFSVQPVTIVKQTVNNAPTTNVGTMGKAVRSKVSSLFILASPSPDGSISGHFGPEWTRFAGQINNAVNQMAVQASNQLNGKPITFGSMRAFPTSVTIYKTQVPTTVAFGSLNYGGKTGGIDLGAGASTATLAGVAATVSEVLSLSFNNGMDSLRRTSLQTYEAAGGKPEDWGPVQDVLDSQISSLFGVAVAASNTVKKIVRHTARDTSFSPVFPVSDAQGYEVIGNYRYGRGVSIEPDGVFDQIHKLDIFSMLDKTLVEMILQFFVQNKGKGAIKVPGYKTQTVAGVKKTGPVAETVTLQGPAAAKYLNEELLSQLRGRGLTDKQILDYGFLLNGDGDVSQLHFSLANIFADKTLDGIQKIPVINAAYSLADMNLQQAGHVCDCKAAEADIHLMAFGQEDFLQFSQTGSPQHEGLGEDPASAGTRWVAHTAAQAASGWQQQQQALRGQVMDRGGSYVVKQLADAFTDSTGPSESALSAARAEFERQVEELTGEDN